MGKSRKVPEDLMGTILSESFEAAEESQNPSESGLSSAVSWEERPERVGVTFNLSKQLAAELESLRGELRSEEARPSRSEIAEAALRIAVEDVRARGEESELSRRLGERGTPHGASIPGGIVRRSVDDSGWIFETTHDENGEIIDEDVVGVVAELPVVDEYVDEEGRLVSVAKDELGNTFERIMDEQFNTLATRLLESRGRESR